MLSDIDCTLPSPSREPGVLCYKSHDNCPGTAVEEDIPPVKGLGRNPVNASRNDSSCFIGANCVDEEPP